MIRSGRAIPAPMPRSSPSIATLTVPRYTRGRLGNLPKTLWVLDYPLLERIYYALVAGFDIYGTTGHQLTTRALHGCPAGRRGEQLPGFSPPGKTVGDHAIVVQVSLPIMIGYYPSGLAGANILSPRTSRNANSSNIW